MLSNVECAAAALREAREARKQIALVASTFNLSSIDEAYAAAAENTRVRLTEGRRVTGRKIGLTAESVQRQLGVDQPDFGVLFDDMEILDRGVVMTDRLMQPKIKAEIAFVIARDLKKGRTPSWGEFVTAIDYALPALEIVDSAIADWRIGILDTSPTTLRLACTCSATSRFRLVHFNSPRLRRFSPATERWSRKDKAVHVLAIRCEPLTGLPAKWPAAGKRYARVKSSLPARSGRPLRSNRAVP